MDFLGLLQEFSDMEPDEAAQLSGSELAVVRRALRLAALVEEAETALQGIDNFSWSAVRADCEDAREFCMNKITNCRSVLARIAAAKAEGGK